MTLKRSLFDVAIEDKTLPFPKLFETYFLKTVTVLDELAKTSSPVTLELHSTPGSAKPTTAKDFVLYLCEQLINEKAKQLKHLKLVVVR